MEGLLMVAAVLVGGYVYYVVGSITAGYEEGRCGTVLPWWQILVVTFVWPVWWLARVVAGAGRSLARLADTAYYQAYKFGNRRRAAEAETPSTTEPSQPAEGWMGY